MQAAPRVSVSSPLVARSSDLLMGLLISRRNFAARARDRVVGRAARNFVLTPGDDESLD
jgi:hypothetical protein